MRLFRRPSILFVTLALGAPLFLARPEAMAQPTTTATAAATTSPAQQADELFLKGKGLLKEGKKQDALAAYRAAWKLRKSYDVAGNLGSLEVDLGQYRDAAEHLSYALSHYAASGTTKDQLDRAKQRFDTARKEVCTLHVTANVEGAEVLVDGTSIGRAPLGEDIFVTAGAHTIEARFPGQVTATKTLDAKKGAIEEVKLELTPLPAPSATATASGSATVSATAPVLPPRSNVPAFVIGGVGVAVAVVGGALLGAGFAELGEVDKAMPRDANGKSLCVRSADAGPELKPECPALRSKTASAQTMANAGLPMLILGGVAIAGAVAYVLWPGPKAEPVKSASRVVPFVSTDGAGFVWLGSF